MVTIRPIDLSRKNADQLKKDWSRLLNPLTSIPHAFYQVLGAIGSFIAYPATYSKTMELKINHVNGTTLLDESNYANLEGALSAYTPIIDAFNLAYSHNWEGDPQTMYNLLGKAKPISNEDAYSSYVSNGWKRVEYINKAFADMNKEKPLKNGKSFIIERSSQLFLVDGYWGSVFGKNKLDCETLAPTYSHEDSDPIEHVFYFLGNGQRREDIYDDLNDDIVDAKNANIHLVAHTMNHSGVGRSTGRIYSFKQLVDESEKWVKHYIETEQVDPKTITLKTHSMGAAVATVVASRLHKQGYPVNLHHGRSFSEIAQVAAGWFGNNVLVRGIMRFLSWLSGWNVNVTKAYQTIPEEYRRHHLLKRGSSKEADPDPTFFPSDNIVIYKADTDNVIPYQSSLHFALKESYRKEKKVIRLFQKHLNTILKAKDVKDSTLLALLTSTSPTAFKEELAFITQHLVQMQKWFSCYARHHDPQLLRLLNTKISDMNVAKISTCFDYLYFIKFKANKFDALEHNSPARTTEGAHTFPLNKKESIKFTQNQFFVEHLLSKRFFFNITAAQPSKSSNAKRANQTPSPAA